MASNVYPRPEPTLNEFGVRLTGKRDWENNGMHRFLAELFPEHRTDQKYFDVPRLAHEMGLSHEAIYQWFRKNRLDAQNVIPLIELSKKHGSRVPEVKDFEVFVYGA